jgi:hypothetical protein
VPAARPPSVPGRCLSAGRWFGSTTFRAAVRSACGWAGRRCARCTPANGWSCSCTRSESGRTTGEGSNTPPGGAPSTPPLDILQLVVTLQVVDTLRIRIRPTVREKRRVRPPIRRVNTAGPSAARRCGTAQRSAWLLWTQSHNTERFATPCAAAEPTQPRRGEATRAKMPPCRCTSGGDVILLRRRRGTRLRRGKGRRPVWGLAALIAHPEGGDLPQETGNFPRETGNFPQETGNLPQETGILPWEIGNLPQEIGNLPQEMGNLPRERRAEPRRPPPGPHPQSPRLATLARRLGPAPLRAAPPTIRRWSSR